MPRLQLKGINLMPARESFDPIETASRDEITALQLERLKWSSCLRVQQCRSLQAGI